MKKRGLFARAALRIVNDAGTISQQFTRRTKRGENRLAAATFLSRVGHFCACICMTDIVLKYNVPPRVTEKGKNTPMQNRTVIALNLPQRKLWRWGRKIMRYNDLKMKPPFALSAERTHRGTLDVTPSDERFISLAVLSRIENLPR